jgi:hypothetical protein
MKTLHHVSDKLILIAIACIFIANGPIQARETRSDSTSARSGGDARLIVKREANFGLEESVNLFVDGVQVAALGVNQSYDATLPPGRHVLSITTNPTTYSPGRITQTPVDAKAGRAYSFTAVWDDAEHASLEQ